MTKGNTIGSTIKTIGTHSKGHPNKKIAAIIIANITYLFTSKFKRKSVNRDGVTNFENTAQKKFDSATKNIIKAVISKVFKRASFKPGRVNFFYARASKIAPNAPIPAPSVAVSYTHLTLPTRS